MKFFAALGLRQVILFAQKSSGRVSPTLNASLPFFTPSGFTRQQVAGDIKLEEIWSILAGKGIDKDYLLSRSLISPATCCLVNPDGEKTVEEAFRVVQNLSGRLREKYNLA